MAFIILHIVEPKQTVVETTHEDMETTVSFMIESGCAACNIFIYHCESEPVNPTIQVKFPEKKESVDSEPFEYTWNERGDYETHCPVADGTKIIVKFRSGKEIETHSPESFEWKSRGYDSDIVAYKFIK